MKKYFLLLIGFFLTCRPSQVDYSHIRVKDVIDGDTIILENGETLRYIGIDTPELRKREGNRFIFMPQPFGKEAKEFNEKMVKGEYIKVEFDIVKRDRYGRLLGYCFKNDLFINLQLLKEGYAFLYTYPPNVKYVDLFIEAQKEARDNHKGIWGVYETISAQEAHRYIGQIRTVRGRVVDTYQSKHCVFLNFGEDYRTDFTVVIFKEALSNFYKENINPKEYYKGKIIEVTGKIKEFNGPQIVVNYPYEIKVDEGN